MRLSECEIKEKAELVDIIERADVCRIAFAVDKTPYIVALNYGYEWDGTLRLYAHGAIEGRMIDCMKKNPFVCFQMDIGHGLFRGKTAHQWGMTYKSIVGYGTLTIIEGTDERKRALDLIMAHYGSKGNNVYDEKALEDTCVLRLEASEVVGKKRVK
ncbi:MAG: pyridoxamine 5'-phosphate oxidase family protein [Thermodesulfobacteriota bacterium]|jgi:nitroimidazol reductase NimA-like FMN-containing flavoprotein (pyridoxamine 5'-phosphate oxidase superfamily)